jgi:hypothetical protein
MHEVKIPNPAEQYRKTPAFEKVRVKYEYVTTDGRKVEEYRNEMRLAIGDSGLEARVLTLADWLEEQLKDNAEALFTISKAVNVNAKKPEKIIVSRSVIIKGLIRTYKGKVETTIDDEFTLEEELRSWAVKEGRWGLGCPNNCGRFWTFKPTEDLKGFEPEDPAAKNPYTDRNGDTHNGYLEWTPQSDGSVIFKCDNCKAEIKLTV